MKVNFDLLPKMSRLFLDYLYEFDNVADFFEVNPYRFQGYIDIFEKLEKRNYQREILTEVLREQNEKWGNTPETLKSISLLKDKKTFVVFTGQQVGLFGGPLYTIYKALTCINMAKYLSENTNYRFLPLFWIEGEDHDFEEIKKTYIIDQTNNILELDYNPKEPYSGICVGDMILDENIHQVIDRLSEGIQDTDFKEGILTDLKECYRQGGSMADAFSRWILKLLGKYGLIGVDPSHPRLKREALPVFLKSIRKHRNCLNFALTQVSTMLEEKGYHNQIKHRTDTLDFFYHDPRRLPLIANNGEYGVKNTSLKFDYCRLKEFAKNQYLHLSPNVILRPQVQDYIFPTAMYVAGPSEIAYFAQYRKVYDIFETPMPIIFPRKSLTVLEPRVARIMKKYNLNFQDILIPSYMLESRILKQNLPEELSIYLEETRFIIFQQLNKLQRIAEDINPNLKPAILNLKAKTDKELKNTETRISRAFDQEIQILKNQIDKLHVHLFPQGGLQERKINIITYLYKYGYQFIDSLKDVIGTDLEGYHKVWEINSVVTLCFEETGMNPSS